MNEAAETAVEKPTEEGAMLFPLDQPEPKVEIEVMDGEESKITLVHKLKWPTLQALIERAQQTPTETVVLGPNEKKAQDADAVAANAKLWDKFAVQVMGYEMDGVIGPDEWAPVTPQLIAEIPSEHKSEAIVGLLFANYEIERPKGRGFVLGASTYRVKQKYLTYEIWHVLGKPSEKDRREFARKVRETRYQTGSTKVKSKTFTNLKPYTELYDKLFLRLEGVMGDDPNIASRKDLVSAIWKQSVIDELMTSFDASRRD